MSPRPIQAALIGRGLAANAVAPSDCARRKTGGAVRKSSRGGWTEEEVGGAVPACSPLMTCALL